MATQASNLPQKAPVSSGSQLKDYVTWFYAAIIILHLPTLLLYFRSLWDQPHYQQFFLFAIAAAGVFIYMRLQTFEKVIFRTSSTWPNVFLGLAVVPLVVGNMIFDINIIAFGIFLVVTSFLGRICDRKTLLSLMPAALILLPVVRPPSNLDIDAISMLQQFTSNRASEILDVFGVAHHVEGNTISLPEGGQFFVEEACSGVQSLFTLIFCGLAFAVFERRHILHTILLVFAAFFWAAFGNTMRVVLICLADLWNINLAEGFSHMMLGYFCLGFGILMLFSTDRFMTAFFGVQDADDESGASLFKKMKRSMFPNADDDDIRSRNRKRFSKTTSVASRVGIVIACLAIIGVSLIPFARLGVGRLASSLFETRYNVSPLAMEVMPKEVKLGERTKQVEWGVEWVELKKRETNSDWGTYSNIWFANSPEIKNVQLTCDYPFFAFHELSGCYRGNGWKIKKRTINREYDAPFVEVEMAKNNGEKGFLIFSLVDKYAEHVPVETADINRTNFIQRGINSFNRRFRRDYGPGKQSFQVQLFHPSSVALSEEQKQDLRDLFLFERGQVVQEIESD